jgi:hypothetical protein
MVRTPRPLDAFWEVPPYNVAIIMSANDGV